MAIHNFFNHFECAARRITDAAKDVGIELTPEQRSFLEKAAVREIQKTVFNFRPKSAHEKLEPR